MLDAIAKTKAVQSVRFTSVIDFPNDNEGVERLVTDYVAPDRSRTIDEEGVTIIIGLDSYRAATLAGPYNHTVSNRGVGALNFLDELGDPGEVTRKGDVYEFKTEVTATASVTVKAGYIRIVQIVGKSEGYPATTSTWLLNNIDAPGIVIEPPTNLA